LLSWIAKGLAGDRAERDAARAALRAVVNGESVRGGALGAAASSAGAEDLQEPGPPPPPAGPPLASWRERVTEPGMGVPPPGSWRQRAPQ